MTRFPNSARSAWLQSRESKSISTRVRKQVKRLTLAERIEKRTLDALMSDITMNLKRFVETKDFAALECIRDYVADRVADDDKKQEELDSPPEPPSRRYDEDTPF